MSLYSDAPVPTTPEAQFAAWMKSIDERLHRIEHKRGAVYVIEITGTTDSGGFLTFEHAGKTIPQGILIQPIAPISLPNIFAAHVVDSLTETTARLRAVGHTGNAIASASITFFALVLL